MAEAPRRSGDGARSRAAAKSKTADKVARPRAKAGRASKAAPEKPKVNTWGGARPGAGRPRTSTRVTHLRRDRVTGELPCHVSLKLMQGMPSLKSARVSRILRAALEDTKLLEILEHSVVADQLHLLVGVQSSEELARGMQSFTIRFAKRLNALLDRSGHVFEDRYRVRVLKSKREVRNALPREA
jgi:hypothetical protein